jgi:hypothetical protein
MSELPRIAPADRVDDARLARVLREAGAPGVLEALAERLSPTDLQTLLLAAYRRRAAAVTPGRLLEQDERNRFRSSPRYCVRLRRRTRAGPRLLHRRLLRDPRHHAQGHRTAPR